MLSSHPFHSKTVCFDFDLNQHTCIEGDSNAKRSCYIYD